MPKAEVEARARLAAATAAITHLRHARRELRAVGASQAADYVSRAIKSAEGAARHAQRLLGEAQREEA